MKIFGAKRGSGASVLATFLSVAAGLLILYLFVQHQLHIFAVLAALILIFAPLLIFVVLNSGEARSRGGERK